MATAKKMRVRGKQPSQKKAKQALAGVSKVTVRFGRKNTAHEVTKKTVATAAKKAGLSMNHFLHVAVARYILIRESTGSKPGTFSEKKLAHIRIVANPLSKKTGRPISPPALIGITAVARPKTPAVL